MHFKAKNLIKEANGLYATSNRMGGHIFNTHGLTNLLYYFRLILHKSIINKNHRT